MFVRLKAIRWAIVYVQLVTSLLFAIHIGAQENTVHKKEVGLTKMIILILVCPKKVYWKQLLYQMSFVNVYRGSKFYEV